MNHMSEGFDSRILCFYSGILSVKFHSPTSRFSLCPTAFTRISLNPGEGLQDDVGQTWRSLQHWRSNTWRVNIFIFRLETLNSSSELTGPLVLRRFCWTSAGWRSCCFLFNMWFCSRHWKSHKTVLVSLYTASVSHLTGLEIINRIQTLNLLQSFHLWLRD